MPKVTKLCLAAEQVEELTIARDRHPKAYIREKAAVILKVNQGQSMRQVALQACTKGAVNIPLKTGSSVILSRG